MSLKRSFAFFLQIQQMLLLLSLLLFANFSYADVNDLQLVPRNDQASCAKAQQETENSCATEGFRSVVAAAHKNYFSKYSQNEEQLEGINNYTRACLEKARSCLKACGYSGDHGFLTGDIRHFVTVLGTYNKFQVKNEKVRACLDPIKRLARFKHDNDHQEYTGKEAGLCQHSPATTAMENVPEGKTYKIRCDLLRPFTKAEVQSLNCKDDEVVFKGECHISSQKPGCEGGKVIAGRCLCKGKLGGYNIEATNGKCENNYRPNPDPPCKDPNKESINGECVVKCQLGFIRDANGKCQKKPRDCKADEDFVNGKCVPQCLAGQTRDSGGTCQKDDDDDDDNDTTGGGGKKEDDKITKADFDKLKEAMDNAANNFNGGGGNNFSDIGQVSYDSGGDFDSSSNSFDEGSNVPYGTAEVNVAGVTDSVRATIPRFSGDRLIPSGPQLSDPQDKGQPPGNNNRGGGLGGNPNLGGGGTKAKAQKPKKAARRGRSSLWAKAKQLVTGSFFGGAPAGGEENNSPAKKSQYQQQARRSGRKSKYFRKQDLQRADLQKLNKSFHANMPGFGQPIGKAITDVNLIRSLYADYRDNMLNRYGCEPPQTSCGVKRKRKTASSRKPSSIKKKRKRKLRRKKKRRRKR